MDLFYITYLIWELNKNDLIITQNETFYHIHLYYFTSIKYLNFDQWNSFSYK